METPSLAPGTLVCQPIGIARTGFAERAEAPHQPVEAQAQLGVIELFPGNNYEHALLDIETWSHLWLVFWFHHNETWRPKVQPPRSDKKRGVFATRSPYRPNPLGLSLVKLEKVKGLDLHVSGIDLLDGTPVLDIKPYVPFADQVSDANHGWLGLPADPHPRWQVTYRPEATCVLDWLVTNWQLDLKPRIEQVLVQGPAPHAYRRIRQNGDGYVLALKEWRVHFAVQPEAAGSASTGSARTLVVSRVESGYRAQTLQAPAGASEAKLAVHRALAAFLSSG